MLFMDLRGRNALQLVVDCFCYIFAHNQFAYMFTSIYAVCYKVHNIQGHSGTKLRCTYVDTCTYVATYDIILYVSIMYNE